MGGKERVCSFEEAEACPEVTYGKVLIHTIVQRGLFINLFLGDSETYLQ